MTKFIQFTSVYKNRTDIHVQQYGDDEMEEVFSVHERMWLSEGKIVEREDRISKTTIVDLQAHFNRNK